MFFKKKKHINKKNKKPQKGVPLRNNYCNAVTKYNIVCMGLENQKKFTYTLTLSRVA